MTKNWRKAAAVLALLAGGLGLAPQRAQAFFCFSFSFGGGPRVEYWTPGPFNGPWYGPVVTPSPPSPGFATTPAYGYMPAPPLLFERPWGPPWESPGPWGYRPAPYPLQMPVPHADPLAPRPWFAPVASPPPPWWGR